LIGDGIPNDHAIAVRQWRHYLTACVKASDYGCVYAV